MEQKKIYKLVYIFRHMAYVGGIERVVIDKMNYLANNGCQVTLVTCEQGTHPYSFNISKEVETIDTNHRFFTLSKCILPLRLFKMWIMKHSFKKRLQEIIDDRHADIIICAVDPFLCRIIKHINTNTKWIVESHLAMEHTFDHSERFVNIPILRKLLVNYHYSSVKRCDMIVTLTKGDAQDWQKWNRNVCVIPNPVTSFPNQVPCIKRKRRIIAVGRLNYQKGFDRLIKAFGHISNQCPEWTLDIFGKGVEEAYLRKIISNLNLNNRVKIHPVTSHIYDEYYLSEFYVMSSRYEGFALVLLEALACGLPCVAFNCKYGPEDIISNLNGILVQEGDIEGLADKMLWMINHPNEREIMRKFARETASLYRKEVIMPKWFDLFENI